MNGVYFGKGLSTMNHEIENMLKKQAAWQRSRKDGSWLEKLRKSRDARNSPAGFALTRARTRKREE